MKINEIDNKNVAKKFHDSKMSEVLINWLLDCDTLFFVLLFFDFIANCKILQSIFIGDVWAMSINDLICGVQTLLIQ